MLIMQHEARPSISAANPLPTAFWRTEFRCRPARQNAIQAADIRGLFAIEAAFLRGQTRVSPCSQGPAPLPGSAPQYLDPQRQRRTEPECEAGVVGDAVIGQRMHQNVKTFAIEH